MDNMIDGGRSTTMIAEGNMVAADRELSRDEESRREASARLEEACERTTFHRIEAERWARIARSEAARVRELDSAEPVAALTPDELFAAQPDVRSPA